MRQSDIKISNDVPFENTGVNESYRVDVRNTYKDVEKELIRNMYNRLRKRNEKTVNARACVFY